jgi:putative ABC transport system permease protein
MLLFGAVLAGALLFNAMTANAAERTAELGALQAAGMDRRTIGRLVGAENLLLAAAGILPGLLAGHQLARAFMSTYETEGYSWALQMRGSTLVAAAAVVLLTTVVAQWPALRGLRRLDLARVVRERAL